MVSFTYLEVPCRVDIPTVVFVNAVGNPSVINLHPNSLGVDFGSANASISFIIAPGVIAVITEVKVPTRHTNVNQITVTIAAPDGTISFGPATSTSDNTVNGFPTSPLPIGSTVTIAPSTSDGQPAQNVTLDVIACYTASTTVAPTTPSQTTPFVCPFTGGM